MLWSLGDRREIEYTCTADSIVCLYCFPIHTVKELIVKNTKFEAILYKEMMPLLLRLHEDLFHKLTITAERWSELKSFVTFRKVLKE